MHPEPPAQWLCKNTYQLQISSAWEMWLLKCSAVELLPSAQRWRNVWKVPWRTITTREGKLLAIALTAWVSAFSLAQQMQPEHLPPSQCLHTCKQPSLYFMWLSSHHTSLYLRQYRYYLYTAYALFIYYIKWFGLSCPYTHSLQQ